jgi:hypothetical protein
MGTSHEPGIQLDVSRRTTEKSRHAGGAEPRSPELRRHLYTSICYGKAETREAKTSVGRMGRKYVWA